MNQREEVAETRRRVENQYGRELASKASDVFCLAFGRQTPQVFAAFEEGVTEAPPASAIVVECVPDQERMDRVRNAAAEVKRAPAWGGLQESLTEVRTSELRLRPGRLLRQAAIEFVRDAFFKTAGPITVAAA